MVGKLLLEGAQLRLQAVGERRMRLELLQLFLQLFTLRNEFRLSLVGSGDDVLGARIRWKQRYRTVQHVQIRRVEDRELTLELLREFRHGQDRVEERLLLGYTMRRSICICR